MSILNADVGFQLALFVFFAASPSPGHAQNPTTTRLTPQRGQAFLDFDYCHLDGFVRVRENADLGTRLPFKDLGLDHAEVTSLGYVAPLTDQDDFLFRLRDFHATGSGNFADNVHFNGVIYLPDASVDAEPILLDFLAQFRGKIFDLGDRGCVRLLAGINFDYLTFRTNGHRDPSSGADTSEGFYLQALPLPSLGLRVDYRLTDDLSVYGEAFGFGVHHWNSLRSEGGTVYLTQDNFESSVGFRYRFAPHWELDGGFRYDYLMINETSIEDGNRILWRDYGAFVGIRVSF